MKHLIVLSGLCLAACSQAAPQLSDFQNWIEDDYVAPFKIGDIDAWTALFDREAIALHNKTPAFEGIEGVRQFGSFVAQNVTVSAMTVDLTGLKVQDDWAMTWGTYNSKLTLKQSGEPMPGHNPNGKVLFVWEKQPDGRWLILADMGNELPVQ